MATLYDPSQFIDALGQMLGTSGWMTVSQEQIDAFADVTGDHQWIHVDPERASTGPYGTTIAHGFLVLSLVPRILADVVTLETHGVVAINYGLDRVRFPSATLVGTAVRGRVDVGAAERIRGGTAVTFIVSVESDSGDKPTCVANVVIRYVGEE